MQHARFALATFPRVRQGKWGWNRIATALVAATAVASCGPGLVALETLAPSVRQDIRYAGADNFVGAPIDGHRAARALARVEEDVSLSGFTPVVFDCYRPQRAVDHFLRWAADDADQRTKSAYYPFVSKEELFSRGHSRGSTVDVTLARVGEGGVAPLDMGMPSIPARTRRLATSRPSSDEPVAGPRGDGALAAEPYPDRYFDVPVE